MIKNMIVLGNRNKDGKKLVLLKGVVKDYFNTEFPQDLLVVFMFVLQFYIEIIPFVSLFTKIIIMFKIKSLFKNV
jgi:hypothetical protein